MAPEYPPVIYPGTPQSEVRKSIREYLEANLEAGRWPRSYQPAAVVSEEPAITPDNVGELVEALEQARRAGGMHAGEWYFRRIDAHYNKLLARVTFGPALPLNFVLIGVSCGVLLFAGKTRDRDTGNPTMFMREVSLDPYKLEYFTKHPDAFFDLVHATLLEVLLHELDEAFMLDGVRVRDPHRMQSVEVVLDQVPAVEAKRREDEKRNERRELMRKAIGR